MTQSHTPGPWFTFEDNNWHDHKRWFVGSDADDNHVVAAAGIKSEANARLIAAAPELLEALQKARIQLHTYYIGTVKAYEQREIELGLDKIDAAIAKAKGE